MQNLIATTFEVVHYIALQAVHYKPLQEVHLSRYNQVGGAKKSFSASEAETIAESFRDLAKRLNCLAEEILALSPISSV